MSQINSARKHLAVEPMKTATRWVTSTLVVANAIAFGLAVISVLLKPFLTGPIRQNAATARRWRNAVASPSGAALVLAAVAFLPKPDDFLGEIQRFSEVEGDALRTFSSSMEKVESNQLDDKQFVDVIEQQVLPKWRAEREALMKRKRLRNEQQRLASLLIGYMTAREEGWKLMVEGVRTRDPEKITMANQKYDEAERLVGRIKGGADWRGDRQTAEDRFQQGVARYQSGDLGGTIAECDRAVQLNPKLAEAYPLRGVARQRKGDLDGAIADFDQAIRLNPGVASNYDHRGNAKAQKGDSNGALADYHQAICLNPKDAAAYHALVAVYGTRGEVDRAEVMADKAAELYQRSGNQEGVATVYGLLGSVCQVRGDTAKAEVMFNRALKLDEALGNKMGMAVAFQSLGAVYSNRREPDQAEAMFNQALPLFEALGDKQALATTYGCLGEVYTSRGQPQKAGAVFTRALALEEGLRNKGGMALAHHGLGTVYQSRGELEKANQAYGRALALFQEINATPQVAQVRAALDRLRQENAPATGARP